MRILVELVGELPEREPCPAGQWLFCADSKVYMRLQ